jgi:PEP-CTERM motif
MGPRCSSLIKQGMNMKAVFTLSLAVAALVTTVSAQAVIVDAKFSGVVQSQSGTTFATGAPISGEFIYDTVTSQYTSFVIGGLSVATGYESKADMTPDGNSVLYQAQVSAALTGGPVNNTFALNLEAGTTPFPLVSAAALLTNAALFTKLDFAASTFGFYSGNANGTNIKQLTASLNALSITAVPEPATWALFAAGAALLSLRGVRKTKL